LCFIIGTYFIIETILRICYQDLMSLIRIIIYMIWNRLVALNSRTMLHRFYVSSLEKRQKICIYSIVYYNMMGLRNILIKFLEIIRRKNLNNIRYCLLEYISRKLNGGYKKQLKWKIILLWDNLLKRKIYRNMDLAILE